MYCYTFIPYIGSQFFVKKFFETLEIVSIYKLTGVLQRCEGGTGYHVVYYIDLHLLKGSNFFQGFSSGGLRIPPVACTL